MEDRLAEPEVRLTALAHGGGCGCKLAPSVLEELLARQPRTAAFSQLLVGTETGDDAAVWQVDDNTCVIATTDFFMPMVDDPRDFGRFNAAYREYFGDDPPARSTVRAELVLDGKLEVEAIAYKPR